MFLGSDERLPAICSELQRIATLLSKPISNLTATNFYFGRSVIGNIQEDYELHGERVPVSELQREQILYSSNSYHLLTLSQLTQDFSSITKYNLPILLGFKAKFQIPTQRKL